MEVPKESLRRVVRFGVFEVDLRAGELFKQGLKIKLQQQPFRVLALLLERPGEVVTREDLRQAIWPAGTFVEFDVGIDAAIHKLRTALGDSAENPRLVETLPRRGYRFIAAVDGAGAGGEQASTAAAWPVLTAGSNRATHAPWRPPGAALGGLVIIGGAAASVYASKNSQGGQSHANVVPFTSSPGQKSDPVFSPGGNEIAYTWKGENDDNSDIYVKLIGAGGPLRLTSSPAEEYCPAWSPDGRYIAFMRGGDRGGIGAPSRDRAYYLIPALGGAERKIGEAYGQRQLYEECLEWSRDGKYLLVADRMAPEDARSSILLLSVEDGQRRVLVSQPDLYVANPIGSPDGTAVAYVQGAGFLAGDIYVVAVSGGLPRRVTSDGRSLNGLAWTADGKEIVFASNRGGLWRLWRVSSSGGTPELVNGVGEGAGAPAISPRGDRLGYG